MSKKKGKVNDSKSEKELDNAKNNPKPIDGDELDEAFGTKCVVCKESKTYDEMVSYEKKRASGTTIIYDTYCKTCEGSGKAVKKCGGKCGKIKRLSEFNKSTRHLFQKHPLCKECRSSKDKDNKPIYPRPAKGTKWKCSGCKLKLDESLFSSNTSAKDRGLQSKCKTCQSETQANTKSTLDGYIDVLWLNLLRNAKTRNIKVDIQIGDIIDLYNEQKSLCAITGKKMTHIAESQDKEKTRNKHPDNISVDRIDSKKIYRKGNIQLVCVDVNRSKWDLSMDVILDLSIDFIIHNLSMYSANERSALLIQCLQTQMNNNSKEYHSLVSHRSDK